MGTIHVQGSPSYYECEVNVLNRLEDLLSKYNFKSGIVLSGEKSWQVTAPYFPKFKDISLIFDRYNGECTENEIARIAKVYGNKNCDFIIGIGGGKVIDLAKSIAHELNIDAILIPTLASTCAAWTPLSVIYNDQGEYVKYTVFPRNSLMVLIEPRILLNSPINYLKAGIGDTLAKYYESVSLTEHLQNPRLPIQLALKTAEVIKDVLLKYSQRAIFDLDRSNLSEELLKIIETNILAGGLVGGLGDEYGRIAAAHSIHNALTKFKETHSLLHGEKVAYGILVQLSLEDKFDEIEKLIPFFKDLELPYSLNTLGLNFHQGTLDTIAKATLSPEESIHFMNKSFIQEDIVEAILKLENFVINN